MSRRAVALALGSALAAIALAWIALILPVQHRSSSSAAEIKRLRSELAAMARLPVQPTVATPPTDSSKLQAELRRAIPTRPMGGQVIETLARAAREAGVEVSSIGLGAPSASEGQTTATPVPVQLTVRGGYRETVAFVDRLDELVALRANQVQADGRLIAIGGMEIGAGSGTRQAADPLTSHMQGSAYTMQSEGSLP